MNEERMDAEVAGVLQRALPEMDADWGSRAVTAVQAAQRAPRRPRRRMVAIAVGVAAVLVGLGFVPFPAGRSKGALDRALGAAESATTVHVSTWVMSPEDGKTGWGEPTTRGDRYVTEEWISQSDGGFYRWERKSRGSYSLTLAVGPWEVNYGEEEDRPVRAYELYDPCYLHPAELPDRAQFQRRFETLSYISDFFGRPRPEVQFREYRQVSAWGGYVDVVEARMIVGHDPHLIFAGPYAQGDQVLVVAEIDAASNRLLSVAEYKLEGRRRLQTYEATYEWDVEVPQELKSFELPAGTKLTRSFWWESRANQVIAQEDMRDWSVTLHAVDVNRRGDIVLSLSRVVTPDSEMPSVYNSAPPLVVEAVGGAGERYTQDNGFSCFNARHSGYWTTTLKPVRPGSRPRSITLTIWPYRESPSEDQSVTFGNVPVPLRQNVDDVMAAARDVVQY